MTNLNFETVLPVKDWRSLTYFEAASIQEDEVSAMLCEAIGYVSSFKWCTQILEKRIGFVLPGIAAIFLFEIDSKYDIDKWIWVVIGDLPSAYISPSFANTPCEALVSYVAEMRAWVEAVRNKKDLSGYIPVNALPTIENANSLENRLNYLEKNVLPALI